RLPPAPPNVDRFYYSRKDLAVVSCVFQRRSLLPTQSETIAALTAVQALPASQSHRSGFLGSMRQYARGARLPWRPHPIVHYQGSPQARGVSTQSNCLEYAAAPPGSPEERCRSLACAVAPHSGSKAGAVVPVLADIQGSRCVGSNAKYRSD